MRSRPSKRMILIYELMLSRHRRLLYEVSHLLGCSELAVRQSARRLQRGHGINIETTRTFIQLHISLNDRSSEGD